MAALDQGAFLVSLLGLLATDMVKPVDSVTLIW
jgi:hypothetical protein